MKKDIEKLLIGKEKFVADKVVDIFIDDLSKNSPEFFKDIGEQLLRNSIIVLKRLNGNNVSFSDLYNFISKETNDYKNIMIRFKNIENKNEEILIQNIDIVDYFENSYFKENSKIYEHTSRIRYLCKRIKNYELLIKNKKSIEEIIEIFKNINKDAPQFFQDMGEQLLRNSFVVLKEIKKENPSISDLKNFILKENNNWKDILVKFKKIKHKDKDIVDYFENSYFKENSQIYKHTSNVRNSFSNITYNI